MEDNKDLKWMKKVLEEEKIRKEAIEKMWGSVDEKLDKITNTLNEIIREVRQ
jgi:coenzyme F420-reducing hydrogenase delta subunit